MPHVRRSALLFALVTLVPCIARAQDDDAAEAFRARDWARAVDLYAARVEQRADAETCYRLGYALHALDRLDEALPWHERAAALHGENPRLAATATYNIACVHARQGRTDEAFAALRLAAERGFRRAVQLQRDPDLASLRSDPRFPALVASIEDMAKLVLVVVHDGVETLDFAGPVEVFAAARDAHGDPAYRVRLVAPQARPVRPQHWRTTLTPDFGIADCPPPAVLVIPGGDTGVLDEDPAFVDWVRRTAPECEHVLSVCTGAYVLARAGLLDGAEATTHHGVRAVLQRQYPAVRVVDRKVVDNGRIVTTAGVSSGLDGALTVVARQLGEDRARQVADYIEYSWQPAPAAPAAPGRNDRRQAREATAEPLYRAALAAASGPRADALAAVERALAAGACPTRTLTEAVFQPLRTEPRFREAIRKATWQSAVVMVPDDEPGTRLFVEGTVKDLAGRPVPGAVLYVWQTDAGGTYTGTSMDEDNPRLFAFVRAGADGSFTLRTIRPAAYRGHEGGIEQHVHGRVTGPDGTSSAARLGFADDPFWRSRQLPDWAAQVTVADDGSHRVRWNVTLQR